MPDDGGFALVIAIQTGDPVSPEQSFMCAAANGWEQWIPIFPFRHGKAKVGLRE